MMKKVVVLIMLLSTLFSCFPFTGETLYLKPGSFHFKHDDFRETKTLYLQQRMIATDGQSSVGSGIATIVFVKQLDNLNINPRLELHYSIPPKTSLDSEFFVVIDDQKMKFQFDTITYDITKKVELFAANADNSEFHTVYREKKRATAIFTISDSLSNQINECEQLIIRCYAQDSPYQFTFGQHPDYSYKTYHKPLGGTYDLLTTHRSVLRSTHIPYNLIYLKKFLSMTTQEEYEKHVLHYQNN